MTTLKQPVQMAVIGAPHGIKGEVRVKSFTGDPTALGDYGPLFDDKGRRFEIAAIRPAGEVVVVRIKGVADRNAAEALTGTALFVDRASLPAADPDEFYHADLIGLEARDCEGKVLGTVRAVHNFGGGDILEIRTERGDMLVPFSLAAIPTVDVSQGHIVVDREAAGLMDGPDDREDSEEEKGPRQPA